MAELSALFFVFLVVFSSHDIYVCFSHLVINFVCLCVYVSVCIYVHYVTVWVSLCVCWCTKDLCVVCL